MSALLFTLLCLFLFATGKVRISEVVPHNDVEDFYYDVVELWNSGEEPYDLRGHFLSDVKKNKTRCLLRNLTNASSPFIIAPNEHMSFSFQGPSTIEHKYVNNGQALIYKTDQNCLFRLSKHKETIYFGKLDNVTKQYVELDVARCGASINRMSNSLWRNKDKDRYLPSFPTQDFQNRYPIVGPWAITEILWDPAPGKPQYVKVTCIHGNWASGFNGTCRYLSWLQLVEGHTAAYQLRFEEQKNLYLDTTFTIQTYHGPDQLNNPSPPAIEMPPVYIPVGESIYFTNVAPAVFYAAYSSIESFGLDKFITIQPGVYPGYPAVKQSSYVFGPWKGQLQNKTSGRVYVAFCFKEHSGIARAEEIDWYPNGKNGWREAANGGIQRLSLHSVASEPDNWIGIGRNLLCNLTAEFPQAECPTIDMCTASQCVKFGPFGICKYNALVCNHPNYNICYPKTTCVEPYNVSNKTKAYRFGCTLNTASFGHNYLDSSSWGFYYPPYDKPQVDATGLAIQGYPTFTYLVGAGSIPSHLTNIRTLEKPWYEVGCVNQAVDCEVSKWSDWTHCFTCLSSEKQNRTRIIKLPPSGAPVPGKPCPVLFESRSCDKEQETKCGPTAAPTEKPTRAPTSRPTGPTTRNPTTLPTRTPTGVPSSQPTKAPPSLAPSKGPTFEPTFAPTMAPTGRPSHAPTNEPTSATNAPTNKPSKAPSTRPTDEPTLAPVPTDSSFVDKSLLYKTTRNNNYFFSKTNVRDSWTYSFSRSLNLFRSESSLVIEIPTTGFANVMTVHTKPFPKVLTAVSLETGAAVWSNSDISVKYDLMTVKYIGYAYGQFFYTGLSLSEKLYQVFAVSTKTGSFSFATKGLANSSFSSVATSCVSEPLSSIFILNEKIGTLYSITPRPNDKVKLALIWTKTLPASALPLNCATKDENGFVYVGVDSTQKSRLYNIDLDGNSVWTLDSLFPSNVVSEDVTHPSVTISGDTFLVSKNSIFTVDTLGTGSVLNISGNGKSFLPFAIDQDSHVVSYNGDILISQSGSIEENLKGFVKQVIHEDRGAIVMFQKDGSGGQIMSLIDGDPVRKIPNSWLAKLPKESVVLDYALFPDSVVVLTSTASGQTETISVVALHINSVDFDPAK